MKKFTVDFSLKLKLKCNIILKYESKNERKSIK